MPTKPKAPTDAEQAVINRLEDELTELREKLHKHSVAENRKKQKKRRKGGKRLARKETPLESIFKLSALLFGVVLVVVFCMHDGAYDDFLPSGAVEIESHDRSQGDFVQRYMAYDKKATEEPSGSTKVDMSNAYVDAAGVVPAFNAGGVSTPVQSVKVGVNTPTESYDAEHAFVVNYTKLVEQEYSDIKWLETNFMGVPESEYSELSEYVKAFAQVSHVVGDGVYGSQPQGSATEIHAAVGPAILIRDWASLPGLSTSFHNQAGQSTAGFGGGSYDNWKIDLMLVETAEDFDNYVSGNTTGIDVHYVQVKGTTDGGKGHCFPWGLGQTYIQIHKSASAMESLVLNMNSSGAFTPDEPAYPPATYVEGDSAKTLYNIWDSARNRSGGAYWFPTLEVDSGDLQFSTGASVNTYRATAVTGSIVETHPGDANRIFSDTYKDWYCVGMLVYATQDTWTP